MRVAEKPPSRLAQIAAWFSGGRISTPTAVRMAMPFRPRGPVRTPAEAAAEAEAQREARVRVVLAELDGLTGLTEVKRQVREIYAYTAMGLLRKGMGLPHEATGLHMVFTGNPGTGKTTVARILGRLFREMGLLSQGHIVEVERADLVGEYIGHTAQRTREVIRKATGGLLFIDEAYSLARGGEKDFGKESIDCLVRTLHSFHMTWPVMRNGCTASTLHSFCIALLSRCRNPSRRLESKSCAVCTGTSSCLLRRSVSWAAYPTRP